jgi:DNA-binding FrmR family transcriptional regulator
VASTGMVEHDRYYIDVLTVIKASRAALNNVALDLLSDHIRHACRAPTPPTRSTRPMAAVARLMRRD